MGIKSISLIAPTRPHVIWFLTFFNILILCQSLLVFKNPGIIIFLQFLKDTPYSFLPQIFCTYCLGQPLPQPMTTHPQILFCLPHPLDLNAIPHRSLCVGPPVTCPHCPLVSVLHNILLSLITYLTVCFPHICLL